MAEVDKYKGNETEEELNQPEVSDSYESNSTNESTKPKKAKDKKPKPIKPYVHIDTFLQTAIEVFDISNVQAQGFKAKMRGNHYQRDEKVFVEELKKYLNLK